MNECEHEYVACRMWLVNRRKFDKTTVIQNCRTCPRCNIVDCSDTAHGKTLFCTKCGESKKEEV